MNVLKKATLIAFATFTLCGCDLLESEDPSTKSKMQGTWVLTEASNEQGADILKKVSFPITAIQLTDDNSMIGTMGPLFTYIVYGDSKWIEVSAKMDQLFDYANFRFNSGEFFVADGKIDNFTVEAKLQATAAVGGSTLIDILKIFGVNTSYLQQTIYHKFVNVEVEFEGNDTMIWTLDGYTGAVYNYKDSQGNLVAWSGWTTNSFQKCRLVFTKKTLKLEDIVRNAYQ